ncbi:MAG: aminomethyl-transferring glycine dehydrogenase subunit GcvPA [Pseudomonadales bacterium]
MPFVPHTPDDEQIMLDTIGVDSIEALFDEIPSDLRSGVLRNTPAAITEMELLRLMTERSARDKTELCFIGAGAYQHHIPSAVWDLVGRGEYLTAYTPYQAEASQGTLQVIYEFQTMIARLNSMDVSNASVYEGGSALAEAILMAVRGNRKSKSRRILCPATLHPGYLSACRNIVRNQGIEIDLIGFDDSSGVTDASELTSFSGDDFAAVVVPYPNFFGCLEDADMLTDWAHEQGALAIGVVNPTALSILKPPGEWGESGADIVVGEGQPLGIPVSSGGPYCGFMCCTKALVRQMPGRIIGRTVDLEGKTGFSLTLQAREQHIRRAKATSNICTNQGLLMTAATIYMSLMGDEGLRSVARHCHSGTIDLVAKAAAIEGVSRRFAAPIFHEVVLRLPGPAKDILRRMAENGILAGYDLGECDPELADCMLVNVTETKTAADIERFVESLQMAVGEVSC